MSITTACLLRGNPGYEQVAQAVTALLGVPVEVEHFSPADDSLYVLIFKDPEAGNHERRMTVVLKTTEPSVSPDPLTYCSFYGEGRVTEILAGLALQFGGWICLDTGFDDWTEAKRVALEPAAEMSAVDELNLALSVILPPSVAVELRRVVSDKETFVRVMDALDRYRAR